MQKLSAGVEGGEEGVAAGGEARDEEREAMIPTETQMH
jgi:hypothetical protein